MNKHKQRIADLLTTQTVKGEILITNAIGNNFRYVFGDIFESKRKTSACVMIARTERGFYGGDVYYLQPKENHVLIWTVGFGGENLTEKIPYKNISIPWAIMAGLDYARIEPQPISTH